MEQFIQVLTALSIYHKSILNATTKYHFLEIIVSPTKNTRYGMVLCW